MNLILKFITDLTSKLNSITKFINNYQNHNSIRTLQSQNNLQGLDVTFNPPTIIFLSFVAVIILYLFCRWFIKKIRFYNQNRLRREHARLIAQSQRVNLQQISHQQILQILLLKNNLDYTWENKDNQEILIQDKCSICLQKNCNYKTQCNHYFHVECLSIWACKNNKCPLCKKDLI